MRTRKFLISLIPALPMLMAALLVILVTVIFLTAMTSKAHAQFGGAEQPMFQLSSVAGFTPQSIPRLAFYWVASDLPIGPVSNWVDRIQGVAWTNGNSATRPTNSLLGLRFDGSATGWHLTNNGTANLGGNNFASNTHWVVFYMERPPGFFGYRMLGSRTNGVVQSFGHTDNVSAGRIQTGSPTFFFDPFNITNAWLDFCNTETTPTSTKHYTNGVAGGVSTTTGPIQNNASWQWLGWDGSGSDHLVGYIREIAIWTNYTMIPIEITSLHNYATNLYGYGPP